MTMMMITMIIESCRLTPPHLMDFVAKFFSAAPSFLPASRRAPPFFFFGPPFPTRPPPPHPTPPQPASPPLPQPAFPAPFPPIFLARLSARRASFVVARPSNQSIYLSFYLSIYLPIYLASYLSIYLSLYLSLSSKTFKVYIATCFVFI